jgi:Rit1 DUSP-like domain
MLSELLRRSVNGGGGGGGSSISPASTAGDATGAGAVASPTADAVDGRPGHSRSASAGSCGSSTGTCDAAVCSSIASSVESACSGVSSSYYSTCSDDAPAGAAAAAAAAAARPPLLRDAAGRLLPRLRWLPVLSCKRDRGSLAAALDDALEFVGAHLAAGRSVLLQDCGGHDSCVCVAVAVLLACFTPPGVQSAGAQQLSGPTFVGPWPPSDVSGGLSVTLPPEPVTKQSMRQRLAFVSSCYPIARPARGGLKQVYNYFVSAAAASGVHATVAAEVGYRRRRLGRQGTQALQQQQQEPELPADDSDRE